MSPKRNKCLGDQQRPLQYRPTHHAKQQPIFARQGPRLSISSYDSHALVVDHEKAAEHNSHAVNMGPVILAMLGG